MKLVIVESPTKAKTLSGFLGDKFQIEASMGHVRDLPPSKLGVDVEHDFVPDYVLVKGKGVVVKKLKAEAKKATEIILATDSDREGEAIAFHIKEVLEVKAPFKRIVFHEITKSAIEEALNHPGEIDLKRVDAQAARRVLDRLVGYQLSPVLWRKVRRGLSAGRVQSVAVRLVVEREAEIAAFTPVEYWEIQVKLTRDGKELIVWLMPKTGINVEDLVKQLNEAKYQVAEVKVTESKRSPWPPLMTSTMQRVAANRLGWSAKKTMREAQQLYEKGLITYHRTDSLNLSESAVIATRDYIKTKFGLKFLPEKARYYSSKSKHSQGAHEAIRPTDVTRESVEDGQSGNKLYRLIWERLVMSQMNPALVTKTKVAVTTNADPAHKLTAEGEKVKFWGFYQVNSKLLHLLPELPVVIEGEQWQLGEVLPEQKFTSPPARFNEASLIKVLEQKGIGRPSTYAPILSTIQDRNYVEKKDRQLYPTAIGQAVTEFLLNHFPQIMDYDFTAGMELDLDAIARGDNTYIKLMTSFYSPFAEKVKTVIETAKRVKIPVELTGEKCPTCNEGEVVIRTGRFGKFLSCSRFPDCKYTATYKQIVEGKVCPDCGGQVVVKRSRRGKQFYGCETYPTCKWASWKL